MLPLAQISAPSNLPGASQGLPPLPEGPSLEQIRVPVEPQQGLEIWQVVMGSLLAVGLLVFFIWLYRRLRKPREAPLAPSAAASAELEIAEACATDDDMVAALAAGAIRRLLTQRYHRAGAGLTVDEFVGKLPLRKAAKQEVGAFLKECDRIKFGGEPIDPARREHILNTAHALVRQHGNTDLEEK